MRRIDLSHPIENGMTTYRGLPAPVICDYWTRESSQEHFDDGSTFQIARIEMVANTGTYIDAPFHRYPESHDVAGFALDRIAGIPGVVLHVPRDVRVIGADRFEGLPVTGSAVLVRTGWDRHWGREEYFGPNPCLSEEAAEMLKAEGALLVGIDSVNIDDATTRSRPVHSILLGADIAIVEHLCHLDLLPDAGFRFHAVPAPLRGVGTFPVRAWAELAG